MAWFLDYVGYSCKDSGFIIKEIAIVTLDGERCYNYFITGPHAYPINHCQTINYQYKMHNLMWDFGDYEFNEAMMDIARKLCNDKVYVKGYEKQKLISSLFPSITCVELNDIPRFNELNNCIHERCEVKHGNHCARRKAYEIRHAYKEKVSIS